MTLLLLEEDAFWDSIAFCMQKMRKMKKKDENSWRNAALLFRHVSSRFFLNSALYCCSSNGTPLRRFMAGKEEENRVLEYSTSSSSSGFSEIFAVQERDYIYIYMRACMYIWVSVC